MRPNVCLFEALASAFVAGDPTVDGIVARSARMLGRDWRWLRPLAQRYVETFAGRVRPRRSDAVDFLRGDKRFRRICQRIPSHIGIAHWLTQSQRMLPMAAAKGWRVPSIESVSALADWLGTDENYVEWFADLKALSCKSDHNKLRHYHYRVLLKDSGDVR
ncbi:MAG: hypothetical protein JO065_03060, partial [Acidobacteria bacterium]|nr:hypothetical protein [Acidobacteriota bacterium]